jgi:hypothetical protein
MPRLITGNPGDIGLLAERVDQQNHCDREGGEQHEVDPALLEVEPAERQGEEAAQDEDEDARGDRIFDHAFAREMHRVQHQVGYESDDGDQDEGAARRDARPALADDIGTFVAGIFHPVDKPHDPSPFDSRSGRY